MTTDGFFLSNIFSASKIMLVTGIEDTRPRNEPRVEYCTKNAQNTTARHEWGQLVLQVLGVTSAAVVPHQNSATSIQPLRTVGLSTSAFF